MSTVDRKLSAKTAATSTTGGYYHIILPSGAVFISRKISDADIIKAHNADRLYTLVFDNADLTAGVLSVAHSKGSEVCQITIKTPSNVIYSGYTVTITDDDNLTVDFGGAIDTGNWKLEGIFYLT